MGEGKECGETGRGSPPQFCFTNDDTKEALSPYYITKVMVIVSFYKVLYLPLRQIAGRFEFPHACPKIFNRVARSSGLMVIDAASCKTIGIRKPDGAEI